MNSAADNPVNKKSSSLKKKVNSGKNERISTTLIEDVFTDEFFQFTSRFKIDTEAYLKSSGPPIPIYIIS